MKIKTLMVITAVILGLCAAPVFATEVAAVDVQKVVDASPKVQTLKKEQQAKDKELINFIEKARKEIAKENDSQKKQELSVKYNKQLNEKREKIAKEYMTKQQKIQDEISKIIADQAKAKGYDIVVSKGVVLYTSKDITDDVIKAVKAVK